MSATLTPDDLYEKARRLRVDLAAEPFLLPLIRQAVVTPLPPQWVELSTDDGKHAYRNELTGEIHETHPADVYFLKQINELRDYHEKQYGGNQDSPETRSSSSGWMAFEDPSSSPDSTYYYDFVSKVTQHTRPRMALAGDHLAEAAASLPSDAGRIFDNAVSLHKTPSMKNLEKLEILCFTSWWTESGLTGSRKVYLQLYFSIPTRHFQITVDDSDEVFTISHIVGPTGRVVTAWDLHVGARLQLLGRWTTLMQPSLLTRQWLNLQERQFTMIKRELETELLKYEPTSGHVRKPMTGQIQCADPHRSSSGLSLRKLLTDMETLKTKLAKYRPDVARRFVIPYDNTVE